MPLILGTNSIKDTGYDVANSLRFESAYLQNPSSGASSSAERRTLTWSMWVKRSELGATGSTQYLASGRESSGNYYVGILFNSSDQLRVIQSAGGSTNFDLKTNRVFRDVSAWYHIVVAFDTTQSTSSNRIKIYVNGTQETSFATETYPSQNADTYFGMTSGGDGYPTYIGSNTSAHFSGYMAEVVEVGGSQLNADSFGEFDSDTPTVWKPKDLSDLSFGSTAGTNVYLDFEDSSDLGNDISGGNNDYSLNSIAAADQTPDTCTNNFATLNPLGFKGTIPTFSEGNLNVIVGNTASLWSVPTIGVSSGKWYVEGRLEGSTIASGIYYHDIGFADRPDNAGQSLYASDARVFWISSWDGKINYRTGGSTTAGLVTGLTTIVPGNFFQLYLDMDNELMYWGREGSLLNSTGVSFNGKESLTGEYYFAFADQYTNGTTEYAINFGHGSFIGSNYGTTTVSNFQDANGFGNFKYNPTVTTDEGSKDFLALCTKNLAEFG
jgi:hypothetical protein